MTRKRKPSPTEQRLAPVSQPAYKAESGIFSDVTTDNFHGISRGYIYDFSNLDTYISSRPGLTRTHYDEFRPDEAVPSKLDEIVELSNIVYKKNGIIKSVLDLMSDFACEGIRVSHPNKTIEKFYNKWFEYIKGKDRSERFLSCLYRTARVIVRSMTANVPSKSQKTIGTKDMDMPEVKAIKGELPVKYVILNPLSVGIVGGKFASFVGNPQYYLKPQTHIVEFFQDKSYRNVLEQLPREIKNSLENKTEILLDPNKTFVFHYKKDDWEEWGYPLVFPILQDVVMLNKLKLADSAALDGAISNLRILKLGNLEYKIAPTSAASQKLSEILESHTGGGTIDIIWGPDIELIESKTDIHKFLGEEKYVPHLNSIYDCLGIPNTLTAGGGSSPGATNNYISLKTLIRRLDYGRDKLREFWDEQLKIVQKVMGFSLPAKIEFNYLELGDDSAQKALLVQLADRNIISEEYVQRIFGSDPDIETIRINREERSRKTGRKVKKAGPFHDPQFEIALQKVALQQGYLAPEQVGLEPTPGTEKKQAPFDKNLSLQREQNKQRNIQNTDDRQQKGTRGRPQNSKDKEKRKEKEFKPRIKALTEIWASNAQDQITELLKPLFLRKFNKKTLRQLNAQEAERAEIIKFGVLSNIEPFSKVNLEVIKAALQQPLAKKFSTMYHEFVNNIRNELDIEIGLEERRSIQSLVYAILKG